MDLGYLTGFVVGVALLFLGRSLVASVRLWRSERSDAAAWRKVNREFGLTGPGLECRHDAAGPADVQGRGGAAGWFFGRLWARRLPGVQHFRTVEVDGRPLVVGRRTGEPEDRIHRYYRLEAAIDSSLPPFRLRKGGASRASYFLRSYRMDWPSDSGWDTFLTEARQDALLDLADHWEDVAVNERLVVVEMRAGRGSVTERVEAIRNLVRVAALLEHDPSLQARSGAEADVEA